MAGALVLAAAVGAVGFLSAGSPAQSATKTNGTVSLVKTKLGMVLVNSKGHTIYLFKKDKSGKSSCTAKCAAFWPPLVSAGTPTSGAGVKAALLSRTKRANGTMQVTYNKHPLYTFVLDTAKGQTKGEGRTDFGGAWDAVSAKGAAVTAAAAPTTTTIPTYTQPPTPYP
jgi:predicted lipoprotein with Yx(FWY)xxD motif